MSDKNGTALATTGQATTMLEVISRAARDPAVDVDKLERLLAIQERMVVEGRRVEFCAALARIQAALPQIGKTGAILDGQRNMRSRYAKLEDIDDVVRPLCAEEGFAVSLNSRPVQQGIEYACTLSHRDGHTETKTLVLPVDSGAGRSAVQSMGSTTSYARRYLLSMHLNIITCNEDDDGNGGEPERREPRAQARRAETRPAPAHDAETGEVVEPAAAPAPGLYRFAQRRAELEACGKHRTPQGLARAWAAVNEDQRQGLLTLDQRADLATLKDQVKAVIQVNAEAASKAGQAPTPAEQGDDFPASYNATVTDHGERGRDSVDWSGAPEGET